jgi:predicted metalloenzyme YecM
LAKLGCLLTEAEIGGRPISSYKLSSPVIVGSRRIEVVELPFPKQGSQYPTGLEHAEFVLEEDFNIFIRAHPSVVFNLKNASAPINPDIRIQYEDFAVKFHYQSLEDLIEHERRCSTKK